MNDHALKQPRTAPFDRKAALIASARKHFVQKGFEETSLDDLIADVGGSRRNIYGLFGGKEGILSAVIEQIIGEIAQSAARPTTPETQPREWLIEVGTAFVRQMLAPEIMAVFRQFVVKGAQSKLDAEKLWQCGPERFRRLLADWLIAQHEAGRLHVKDPEFAAVMLPEMFRGSLQIEILVGRRTEVPEDDIKTQVTKATDIFLAACRPDQICKDANK